MRQNLQGHYHQKMNQRQLLVQLFIVSVTFILVALTFFQNGTYWLPSRQTDDYKYDDYHAVEDKIQLADSTGYTKTQKCC